jgi:hypothetical protein
VQYSVHKYQLQGEKVMDSESLKVLQNEINSAINEVFNQSNLSDIFKEYDFIVDKSIKVEYVIELTRLPSHNGIKNQEINGSSQAILEEQFCHIVLQVLRFASLELL